jgi:LacI family transcriptional regulator
MSAQVTLSDVAREAGVSLATASRALNGSATRTVGEELRVRVQAAAQRLRYTPDGIAQAMARGRTTSLGLVVPDIADPRYAAVAAGVVEAATAAGLTVALTVSAGDAAHEAALVEQLQRQRARGVVLVRGGDQPAEGEATALRASLEAFRSTGGGVAVVGADGLGMDAVDLGEQDAAAELVRALLTRGYRQIALLTGEEPTARTRGDALLRAFAAEGAPVPVERQIDAASTRAGATAQVQTLLAADPAIDLVVAVDEDRALGALDAGRAMAEAGLRPVAVAGLDGTDGSTAVAPTLTTVRLPYARAGAEAVALVLAPGTPRPRPRPDAVAPSAARRPGPEALTARVAERGHAPASPAGAEGRPVARARSPRRVHVAASVVLGGSTPAR